MISKIKQKVEEELAKTVKNANKSYRLDKIAPFLFNSIQEFILRKGKRARPLLFILSYLGYAKNKPKNFYAAAISVELLHDFLLVHDDIIDNSATRRGKASLHKVFDKYLQRYKDNKQSGKDLAIVAGDIIYAMAINAFLSIETNKAIKEEVLRKFVQAAIYTETGEFIDLIQSLKKLSLVKLKDIYKVYDYKTAHYTFSCPLTIGATLAKAPSAQVNKLQDYGICLGRAFQIKDDILGLFGKEEKTGKSVFSDLQEGKKTILIWHAYNNSNNKNKKVVEDILKKKTATKKDLKTIRKIVHHAGSLEYSKSKISKLRKKADAIFKKIKMKSPYKSELAKFTHQLLEQ